MYYYQHHIGDLMRETANLNDHQLVTYLRLIWRYYDTEKPIQGDLEDIAFAVRSDEKTVRLLLRHYFTESNNVWTNKRCDEEIAAYHAKVKKAKESANARWSNANALPTDSERNANANESDANQEPITNNQEPLLKTNTPLPPLQGELPANPTKPNRERKGTCTLSTWLHTLKATGEKAVSDYKPLLEYAEAARLPEEFLQLAWDEFKRCFGDGGTHASIRQADWRRHFRNYVEKNYYQLWFVNEQGQYALSSKGRQAKLVFDNMGRAA